MILRKKSGIYITFKLATLFMLSEYCLDLWLPVEKLMT